MKFYRIGTIFLAIVLLFAFAAAPLQAKTVEEGILKKVEYLGNGEAILTVKVDGQTEIWITNKEQYELPSELILGKKVIKRDGRGGRWDKFWKIEQ